MDLEGDILEIGHRMTTHRENFPHHFIGFGLKLDFHMGFLYEGGLVEYPVCKLIQ